MGEWSVIKGKIIIYTFFFSFSYSFFSKLSDLNMADLIDFLLSFLISSLPKNYSLFQL